MFHLLFGVDDVVDFTILLGRRPPHVIFAGGVVIKSADIRFVQILCRVALVHPLSDCPANSAGVRHPDPNRIPEV